MHRKNEGVDKILAAFRKANIQTVSREAWIKAFRDAKQPKKDG